MNKKIEDIQATLSPKVDGLHVLARLLASDPLQFFVVFSSVAGRIPTLARGLSDYAAANAYLEHFVAYQNKRGNRFHRAIVWTGWRDTGSHSRRDTSGTSAVANAAEHVVGRYGLRFNDSASGRRLFERAMTRSSEDGVLWPTLLEREVLQRHMQRLTFADEPFAGEGASLEGAISASGMAETGGDRAFQRLIETVQRGGRKAAEPLLATIDIDGLSDAQVEQLSYYLLDGSQESERSADQRDDSDAQRHDAAEAHAQRPELDLDSGGGIRSGAETVAKTTLMLADIKALLKKELVAVLRIDGSTLSERISFQSCGLDSISGMQLTVVLERSLGIDISPAWLVEHPNIHALGQKIAAELESRPL